MLLALDRIRYRFGEEAVVLASALVSHLLVRTTGNVGCQNGLSLELHKSRGPFNKENVTPQSNVSKGPSRLKNGN